MEVDCSERLRAIDCDGGLRNLWEVFFLLCIWKFKLLVFAAHCLIKVIQVELIKYVDW